VLPQYQKDIAHTHAQSAQGLKINYTQ